MPKRGVERPERLLPNLELPPEVANEVHPRNRLNELTGREWLYFLNSVDVTAYPVSGEAACGHNLRRQHPSPKPPQLMRKIVEFFTKSGEWVLDPFVGVGGTLLACSLSGRRGVGIDIEPAYLDLYHQVCLQEGLDQQIAIADDARNLESHDAITRRRFALILTDPPYSEMLSRPQDGEKKKKTGSSAPTPFTNRPEDLGNVTYDVFLTELTEIIQRSVRHLRDRGYLVVFAKDLQPNEAHHNMLHADIVAHLSQLPGLQFRGYKIWYDQTINLYPFGYPYQFVANQLHQYILIFQKRPPRRPRPGELTQLMLEPVLAPELNGNGHNGATNGVFDGDGLGQH